MRLLTAAWLLLLVWAIVRHGRRSVLLVALAANLLLAVTFGTQPAQACSCDRARTPEEELQSSDAVFSGVVLKVDRSDSALGSGLHQSPDAPHPGPATFDVEESWKGVSENQITVDGRFSSSPGSSCDFNFREGERYLVFATYALPREDTSLHTMACSGTMPLKLAGAEPGQYTTNVLQALGPAEIVLPERVESESVDSTPASGTWSSSSERIVAGAMVTLLALAMVGAFLLRLVSCSLVMSRSAVRVRSSALYIALICR